MADFESYGVDFPENPPRQNPYRDPSTGKWFWFDETGDVYGPFAKQSEAVLDLSKYIYWLDHGPTLWQRVWWPTKSALRWFRGKVQELLRA